MKVRASDDEREPLKIVPFPLLLIRSKKRWFPGRSKEEAVLVATGVHAFSPRGGLWQNSKSIFSVTSILMQASQADHTVPLSPQ